MPRPKIIRKIIAYIELSRPLNNVILAIALGVTVALTGQPVLSLPVLLAIVSAILIAAGGNALNDYNDIATDRINKPDRPLPSGRLTSPEALVFAFSLFVAGNSMAWYIHRANALIAALATICLILYDIRYKNRPLIGNIIVAFLTALAFIYAGSVYHKIVEAIIPAVFSFIFHLGREIIKDAEDIAGDRAQNAETLPILIGKRPALGVATALYVLVGLLVIWPYIDGIYSWRYFAIALPGVNGVLLGLMISLWRDTSATNLNQISRYLKYDMLLGLLAIAAG